MNTTRNLQDINAPSSLSGNHETYTYSDSDMGDFIDTNDADMSTKTEIGTEYKVNKVFDSIERKKIETNKINSSIKKRLK